VAQEAWLGVLKGLDRLEGRRFASATGSSATYRCIFRNTWQGYARVANIVSPICRQGQRGAGRRGPGADAAQAQPAFLQVTARPNETVAASTTR